MRFGTAKESAPVMASITRKPVTPRAAQAPGARGLRIDPSSALTATGRKNPELLGASDDITDLNAKYTDDFTNDIVQLMAPCTCLELP